MKIIRATARLLQSASTRCLIEIQTDEGVTGSALLARMPSDRFVALASDLLVNEDPRAIEYHWQRFSAANDRFERALTAEIAALDIALWDLKARLNAEPLWRTLGGLRPKVNVHVRVPAARSNDALRRWCVEISELGIRGVVLDASSDPDRDATTLVELRRMLGSGSERAYLLDANEQWSPKEAIRAITAIERHVDLAWIASPTSSHDFLGLKRIVDSVRGAVCSGGRLSSPADFLPHLHHRSLNIVELDVARLGITAALRIADAAYGFELPIALTTSSGNLHTHVASALPYCASLEWSTDASVASDVRLESGFATAGDAVGHGINIRTDETARQPR